MKFVVSASKQEEEEEVSLQREINECAANDKVTTPDKLLLLYVMLEHGHESSGQISETFVPRHDTSDVTALFIL